MGCSACPLFLLGGIFVFFKSAKYRKSFLKSLLFVLPGVLITLIFVIYPVLNTAWLSLNSWNGIGGAPVTWVGLQNYVKTLTSAKFWNSMLNAFYFMIGGFVVLFSVINSMLDNTHFFDILSTVFSPLFNILGLSPEFCDSLRCS